MPPPVASLPTVPEPQAAGAIAACYADIRESLGVPVVNLIWRHLATSPAALEWAWATVRPAYRGGRVAEAAAALRATLADAGVRTLAPAALRSAGLDPGELPAIHRVLRTYELGNSMNLVALSAMRLRLTGAPAGGELPRERDRRGAVDGPLPPLPALGDLPGGVAAQVLALNRLGAVEGDAIVASLYLHLAHWPAALGLLHGVLAPLDAGGAITALRDATLARAEHLAAALVGDLGEPPRPAAAEVDFVQRAVERFRHAMIARMLAVGGVLRTALPGAPAPG